VTGSWGAGGKQTLDCAVQTCPSQQSSPSPPQRWQRPLPRSQAAPAPQTPPQQSWPRPPQRSQVRAPPHAVPLGQAFKPSQQASPSAPQGAQISPAPQPIPGSEQTDGVPG
jgi:hypothetical protein